MYHKGCGDREGWSLRPDVEVSQAGFVPLVIHVSSLSCHFEGIRLVDHDGRYGRWIKDYHSFFLVCSCVEHFFCATACPLA